jgi:hypothetical protein
MIKKYHKPIKFVLDYIAKQIKPGAKVLEIGPGFEPFEKATHFCGWTDEESKRLKNYTKVNVSEEKLPYADNEFDFVYLRHVVEDLWNPINCLNEVSRVAKEGWIETPSPICEMTRGIDGLDGISPPWRGYAHHRYIVWNDSNVLKILPKFPMVDIYDNFNQNKLEELLKIPFNWGTFYHFKDTVNYKLLQMGREADFTFIDYSYNELIQSAISEGFKENTKILKGMVKSEME